MNEEYLSWLSNYLEEIYQTSILENFLQLQVVKFELGEIALSTKIAEKHSNFYGFVHGGTLASISDIAMGVSCITLGKRVVTIDMNVSYIKGV